LTDDKACKFPDKFSDLDSFYRGVNRHNIDFKKAEFKHTAFAPKIVEDGAGSGLYKTESLSTDYEGCSTPEESLNRQEIFVALAVATNVDIESNGVNPIEETAVGNPAHVGIDFGLNGLPRPEIEKKRLRLSRELRKIFHVGLVAKL